MQLRPGTDGALALAMINSIIADDLVDHSFIDGYTLGYDRLVEHVRAVHARVGRASDRRASGRHQGCRRTPTPPLSPPPCYGATAST